RGPAATSASPAGFPETGRGSTVGRYHRARSGSVMATSCAAARIVALAACWGASAWCLPAVAAPAERPELGARTHDGFYLRFASGFGVYDELARSEDVERFDGRVRMKARGFAVVREFAAG